MGLEGCETGTGFVQSAVAVSGGKQLRATGRVGEAEESGGPAAGSCMLKRSFVRGTKASCEMGEAMHRAQRLACRDA